MPSTGGRGDFTEKNTRKLRNDLIFITVLLVAVAALAMGLFLLRGEGSTVTVEVNGEAYGVYPLDRDTVVEIVTGDGTERNRLVIRDGVAFMETATCPDGICSAHKPISRTGECIVCLPHKVVVTITRGDTSDDGPDIIA